jgi:hypothetical protein
MSRLLVVLFISVNLFLASNCRAQSPEQVLKVADELFEEGEYFGSIGFYKQAFKLDSTNSEVLYKYGRNLYMTKQFQKASRYLLKAELLGADRIYPNLHFELAQAYHRTGEYRKAKRYYNRAIRPYRRDRKSYWYKKIDQAKDAASWAYKRKDDLNTNAQPLNLGKKTNHGDADFAGVISGKKLYFTALIADSLINGNQIADQEYLSKLYTKVLNSDELPNALSFESKYKSKFNNKQFANLSFAANNRVFFSLCDTNQQCEIWEAKLIGKLLMDPAKLSANINKNGSNNTMPFWYSGEEGNYLFFVSDRAGGFGDLDIWLSKEENFGFDIPINAGGTVNTMGKELSPFYSEEEQTLYFSSDWHFGFGGFDVFKSKGFPPASTQAENLGQPINSNLDDLYFHPYGDSALLSSNRPEGNIAKNNCCSDLYKLHYPRKQTNEDESKSDSIVKKVSISALNQLLPLELYFHNDVPKPSSSDTVTDANYLKLAYRYLALEKDYLEQFDDYVKDEQKLNQIGNFFDDELSESIQRLEEITPLLLAELKKGSQITLNIKAYSSQLSRSDYNLKLSSRRIESLVNYLESYRNGLFIPYLKGDANNGGSLKINKLPYGEFAFLQEKPNQNKVEGIYSYEAIKQRKINILAVTKTNNIQSGLTQAELAKIKLNASSYDLKEVKKGNELTRVFIIENTGKSTLKLYNVVTENPALKVSFPKEIQAGEKSKIICKLNTSLLEYGKQTLSATIVSNALRNLTELKLSLEVIP